MRYSNFKTEKEFKKFLRDNKLLIKDYFEKFEPRYDLLTNVQLEFKDRKTYFNIDFSDKRHMAKWLGDQYKDVQRDYILNKLKVKSKEKEWKFAPSQVECRSIKEIPALNVINYCEDDKIWQELGLTRRYQYKSFKGQFCGIEDSILAIDSREQKPLEFNTQTLKSKLDFGDYCFINEPYFCNVFIERKSIQDLWGTISKGYDRFQREIERAKKQNGYLVVVVDYAFSKAQSYNHNKKHSLATAKFIFHRIRELMQGYDNVQFVFSGGRKKSVELFEKIGILGENVKTIDLQYCLDMKKI